MFHINPNPASSYLVQPMSYSQSQSTLCQEFLISSFILCPFVLKRVWWMKVRLIQDNLACNCNMKLVNLQSTAHGFHSIPMFVYILLSQDYTQIN